MNVPSHAFPPLLGQYPHTDAIASPFAGAIDALALIVGAVGLGVMAWGTYGAVLRLIAAEYASARGQKTDAPARPLFSPYLVLGLEFMIAASAVKTLTGTSWQNVVVLGGLVLARTLLSLSLRWESPADVAPAHSPAVEPLPPPALTGPAVGNHSEAAVGAASMTS